MNKCPYCGAAVNRTMFNRFGKTEGYQALCRECGAIGPTNVVADDMAQKATIAMFTQPAYLLNETGLIRFGANEVVVNEDDLARCIGMAATCHEPDMYVLNRLTAALARKETT